MKKISWNKLMVRKKKDFDMIEKKEGKIDEKKEEKEDSKGEDKMFT